MIQIAIIGVGLIGASLGMALRSANERESPLGAITVTGFDTNARALSEARGRLAIDREARTLADAVRDAHLVIVAVPVQAIRAVFADLAPLLPAGATVTDVASTKTQVLAWARELLPTTVDFIGGHPMAGSEKSGPAAASPDLFRNAIYCLSPREHARETAVRLVEAMVEQIGAKLYYIDPVEHDAYVAGVSHLPFMLSTALMDVVSRSPGWREMAPLAATGFRDVTRLASGSAEMHRDICLTNREALARWLDDMAQRLAELRDQVAAGDGEALLAWFRHAQEAREQWLAARPNMRPGEQEFNEMIDMAYERPGLFGRWGSGPRQRKQP
ncbi:prephenate dehydrogenase [Roseiflexus castenholzii]|jgi:prephenate dehydrogenase|uniref:Prephenate dehydrogenase n=1 Tax=Roseiflexus castenholzii (strain DSM 13941 / HLO8) TaxID=383372 RepID=A7NNC1_ROSCS|nr:prephenate dehydrogenase/arogenate dehydrogenase family protein [Roseiflexus castenholzii]ABU59054.1 Prephenate dehydrogenase [Roseiflexus castenholzii DSM 13941]